MGCKPFVKNMSVKLKERELEGLMERFRRYLAISGSDISLHMYCKMLLQTELV